MALSQQAKDAIETMVRNNGEAEVVGYAQQVATELTMQQRLAAIPSFSVTLPSTEWQILKQDMRDGRLPGDIMTALRRMGAALLQDDQAKFWPALCVVGEAALRLHYAGAMIESQRRNLPAAMPPA